jgi:hypothetical protein
VESWITQKIDQPDLIDQYEPTVVTPDQYQFRTRSPEKELGHSSISAKRYEGERARVQRAASAYGVTCPPPYDRQVDFDLRSQSFYYRPRARNLELAGPVRYAPCSLVVLVLTPYCSHAPRTAAERIHEVMASRAPQLPTNAPLHRPHEFRSLSPRRWTVRAGRAGGRGWKRGGREGALLTRLCGVQQGRWLSGARVDPSLLAPAPDGAVIAAAEYSDAPTEATWHARRRASEVRGVGAYLRC